MYDLVDSASDRRPPRLEDKNTFDVIVFQFFARSGMKNGKLKKRTVAEPGFISTARGNGVTTTNPA